MSKETKAPKVEFTQVWSAEEVAHIDKWRKKNWKKRNCDTCDAVDSWELVMAPATATMFDRTKDKHRLDKVMLQVLFECKGCGSTKHFTASKLGFGTKQNPGPFDKSRSGKGGSK